MLKLKKACNSPLNFDHSAMPMTRCEDPSLTEPDLALTPNEIIRRYASGRPINVKVYNDYTGDENPNLQGIDIRTLDLSEVHDLMNVANTNLKRLEREAAARRKKEEDERIEKQMFEKFEARRKASRKSDDDDGREEVIYLQPELPLKDKK